MLWHSFCLACNFWMLSRLSFFMRLSFSWASVRVRWASASSFWQISSWWRWWLRSACSLNRYIIPIGAQQGYVIKAGNWLNMQKLLATWKFQAPKTKFQTNPNDPNSKFQTHDPPAFVPNGIITGRVGIAKRYGPPAVNVLVIGYWNLRFICNLVLAIWDFNGFHP